MFNRKKDKELDITSLNEVIHIGKKFMNMCGMNLIIRIREPLICIFSVLRKS